MAPSHTVSHLVSRTRSIAAAEHLAKPLLVEEFGKKVPAGDWADAAVIRKLRDPVFRSVYRSVEKSVMRQALVCCRVTANVRMWLFMARCYLRSTGSCDAF